MVKLVRPHGLARQIELRFFGNVYGQDGQIARYAQRPQIAHRRGLQALPGPGKPPIHQKRRRALQGVVQSVANAGVFQRRHGLGLRELARAQGRASALVPVEPIRFPLRLAQADIKTDRGLFSGQELKFHPQGAARVEHAAHRARERLRKAAGAAQRAIPAHEARQIRFVRKARVARRRVQQDGERFPGRAGTAREAQRPFARERALHKQRVKRRVRGQLRRVHQRDGKRAGGAQAHGRAGGVFHL